MARSPWFWLMSLTLLWGLAEASVFFVIPDVVICFITLRYGFRQGLWAVAAAIVGAMLGGVIAYVWGQTDIVGARAYFDSLPAISAPTIARAGREILADQPLFLLMKGAFTSVPYKLYASEAGAAGMSLQQLMLMTPVVRLPRFFIAAVVTAMVAKVVPTSWLKHKYWVLAGFWIMFYAAYWSLAPR
jgi:membrane protein YqaA with SNARE-associated domain